MQFLGTLHRRLLHRVLVLKYCPNYGSNAGFPYSTRLALLIRGDICGGGVMIGTLVVVQKSSGMLEMVELEAVVVVVVVEAYGMGQRGSVRVVFEMVAVVVVVAWIGRAWVTVQRCSGRVGGRLMAVVVEALAGGNLAMVQRSGGKLVVVELGAVVVEAQVGVAWGMVVQRSSGKLGIVEVAAVVVEALVGGTLVMEALCDGALVLSFWDNLFLSLVSPELHLVPPSCT